MQQRRIAAAALGVWTLTATGACSAVPVPEQGAPLLHLHRVQTQVLHFGQPAVVTGDDLPVGAAVVAQWCPNTTEAVRATALPVTTSCLVWRGSVERQGRIQLQPAHHTPKRALACGQARRSGRLQLRIAAALTGLTLTGTLTGISLSCPAQYTHRGHQIGAGRWWHMAQTPVAWWALGMLVALLGLGYINNRRAGGSRQPHRGNLWEGEALLNLCVGGALAAWAWSQPLDLSMLGPAVLAIRLAQVAWPSPADPSRRPSLWHLLARCPWSELVTWALACLALLLLAHTPVLHEAAAAQGAEPQTWLIRRHPAGPLLAISLVALWHLPTISLAGHPAPHSPAWATQRLLRALYRATLALVLTFFLLGAGNLPALQQ
ncbi:MAG: hypothetical protein ACPGUV_11830, partial [Polyangiales bacterium]